MNEKIPSQESNKNPELEGLFKIYPLSEELKDKAELALELKKIFNSLLKKDAQKNNFENFTMLVNFAKNLRNKYKDASDHWAYNMLIGSSTGEGKTPTKFDFPGDDSIEKYLKSKNI